MQILDIIANTMALALCFALALQWFAIEYYAAASVATIGAVNFGYNLGKPVARALFVRFTR